MEIYCVRFTSTYSIRPNYHTVHLGFSKLLGTLICGKICICLLRIHCKKDQKRTYLKMIMQFFLIFFIKAYVQMSNHNICLYKEVKKKYTGCNLKTTEFLDCALIGVCVVIRSNMVHLYGTMLKKVFFQNVLKIYY